MVWLSQHLCAVRRPTNLRIRRLLQFVPRYRKIQPRVCTQWHLLPAAAQGHTRETCHLLERGFSSRESRPGVWRLIASAQSEYVEDWEPTAPGEQPQAASWRPGDTLTAGASRGLCRCCVGPPIRVGPGTVPSPFLRLADEAALHH